MPTRRPLHAERLRLIAIICLIGLALWVPEAPPAAAAITVCRGDPIVWLSNGEIIQMTAQVAANAAEVHQVVYTLHVPRGTTVTRIVYDSGPLGKKERVVLVDDLLPKQYTTDTLVMTSRNGIAVTANANLDFLRASAFGWNNEHVIIVLQR